MWKQFDRELNRRTQTSWWEYQYANIAIFNTTPNTKFIIQQFTEQLPIIDTIKGLGEVYEACKNITTTAQFS